MKVPTQKGVEPRATSGKSTYDDKEAQSSLFVTFIIISSAK